MNRKTGDLFEGHRVCFVDNESMDDKIMTPMYSISLRGFEYDGWIVFNPKASPLGFFLNRKSESWFKNLGEL